MVMHARKLPRLSDGYFEKNQSHSYESSNKYKSNERNSDKMRDAFAEGSGRNDSIEHRNSPRCHKSYAQRLKEKDHHEEASNKSPAMKAENRNSGKDMHKSSLDSEGSSIYQSNHDRNNTEESDRRLQTGDWSEHISSSGKKYYYNCKTEVSQWEKPKELIELERQQSTARIPYDLNRSRDRLHDRSSVASGSKNSHSDEVTVSPENSDSYSCRPDSVPHKNSFLSVQQAVPSQTQSHLLSPSQVTLSNLPKLISQLAGTKGLPNLSELSPQEALKTIQQALQLTKQVTNLSHNAVSELNTQKSPAHSQNQVLNQNHHSVGGTTASSTVTSNSISTSSSTTAGSVGGSSISTMQPAVDDKPEVDGDRASPGSDCSVHSSRHDSPTSSVSSLQSLSAAGTSSLATAALKPSVPSLTPSLANYYREDLISHVTGWQADHAERQANRYWEEGHNIGSLNCTQVSAELKMARALVRLAEIQATLQEQRILFLRQQTKELDDWRSLNSFMSDS